MMEEGEGGNGCACVRVRVRPGQRQAQQKSPHFLINTPSPTSFPDFPFFTLASFPSSKPLNIHTQLAIKSHPPLYLEDVWCFGCGFRY